MDRLIEELELKPKHIVGACGESTRGSSGPAPVEPERARLWIAIVGALWEQQEFPGLRPPACAKPFCALLGQPEQKRQEEKTEGVLARRIAEQRKARGWRRDTSLWCHGAAFMWIDRPDLRFAVREASQSRAKLARVAKYLTGAGDSQQIVRLVGTAEEFMHSRTPIWWGVCGRGSQPAAEFAGSELHDKTLVLDSDGNRACVG